MSVGVVIGRFQVDEIHEGHLELLRTVEAKHPNFMILLGYRRSWSRQDDPLSYQMRAAMLRELFPRAEILPVEDRQTNELWSAQVDNLVGTVFPSQPAVLYGGRDSFIPYYTGRYPTRELDFGRENQSGTSRRRLVSSVIRNTQDFRAGVIYALCNLPKRVIPCVDMAAVRIVDGMGSVALGRKRDENGWRFPGGHIDCSDLTALEAANRELKEETGLTLRDPRLLGGFQVDDWRLRDRTDVRYMTSLFVGEAEGELVAGDDLDEVQFHPIATATVIPDHQMLLDAVRLYFTK